ncbi:MAG: hypothetical protein WCH11_02700, partial [Bdellovibrio sp.]
MKINLQPRDLEILAVIQKYGVISSSQIGQWFFAGVAKTTVLKRIRLLEKGNFIKRGVTLNDGTTTFYMGHQGRKHLQSEAFSLGTNRNTIAHDVLLSQVRWKLESFGLAKDVTPEFQMRSEIFKNHRYRNAKEQLIPDALMIEKVLSEPQAISLELELTIKSKARYKRIFEQYGSKKSITKIWYFCRDLRSLNKILQMSRKSLFDFKGRLWLSVVDDFLKMYDPQLWSPQSGQWHKLSSIGFENFKMPAQAPAHGMSKLRLVKSKTNTEDKLRESVANSLILTSLREGPSDP